MAKGEAAYRKQCLKCHGATGEGGVDHDAKPLVGDRSIPELADYIAKSMPEDDPGSCVGDDARQVSEYIYNAFYSPVAQSRIRPARIDLSRLTARQYHMVAADLVGGFRGGNLWKAERGLKATYYKSSHYKQQDKAFERIDPVVDFHFGEGSPDAEKMHDAEEFSVQWQGAVLAPDSGEYEFIVACETGMQLYVNNNKVPLIDATVKSGADSEFRGSIELLGGRAYPLRLQMSKSKKAKEKSASIVLRWRPPRSAPRVVPERLLSPEWFPETYVATTRFPADDRSLGYERGAAISQAWSQAAADGALETTAYVLDHLAELAGDKPDNPDRKPKLKEFAGRWGERAFRRPLSAEEREFFIERPFAAIEDPTRAIERSLLLFQLSPRFLYCDVSLGGEASPGDAYRVAGRLALELWDSLPDAQLISQSQRGDLTRPEVARRHAERMLDDLRAKAKLREFFLSWLNVERFAEMSKDARLGGDFDLQTITDLRTSLELMLDDVVGSDASDFRQLLLGQELFLNGRLAKLYGAPLAEDAPFQKVTLSGAPPPACSRIRI